MIFQNTTHATPNTVQKIGQIAVAGTIAVINGSVDVVGTSTSFLNTCSVGDIITIASVNYTVASISSNTALKLSMVYVGTTASGLTITQNSYLSLGGGNYRKFEIKNEDNASNTTPIWFGFSRNVNKDGVDITTTKRSRSLSIGESVYFEAQNLENVYVLSTGASQIFSVMCLS